VTTVFFERTELFEDDGGMRAESAGDVKRRYRGVA